MNPTKAMLLREMAMAPDLEVYFLAYKALENLNRLVAEAQALRGPVAQAPFQAQPGVNNAMPYGHSGWQAPQPPPQTPNQFSRSEPAWDEPSERMPWEEEGGL